MAPQLGFCAAMKLVKSALETSIDGSLKILSLCSVFLLFLALYRCRLTNNFLVHNLYAKGYLSPNHQTSFLIEMTIETNIQ